MRHMRLGTWSRRVLAWHNMLHLRRCESSLGHDREAGENGTSTMTSSHDVIQRSDAHVDYEMVKRVIEQTVPMTYTSVAQIARALPCDVLETLSVSAITDENTSGSKDERASPREECPMKPWQGAGLTGFLADHSALFELSRIGPIAVVRRRVGATFPASVCASSFSVDSASHADHKGCTAASSRTVMCTSDCSSSRPDYATHDGDRHTMRACRVTSNPSKRNSYSAECVHAVPALASHSLSEKLRPPPYFVAESSASSSSSWHPAPSHSQRLLLLHHERDALRMERVNIPQAVMRRYPSYLIPVHALWTDCTAGGENEVDKAGRSAGTEESSKEGNMHTRRQQRKECVLRALSFHLPYLTLQGGRWRPGHSSMDDTAENAPGMLISNTCHTKGEPITDTTNANDSGDDDARALEEMYGYVSLSSAATAALRRSRCAGYRSEAAETNEANSAQLRRRQSRRGEERHNFDGTHVAPDLLYTRYRVSEYEWYRVARLIPQLGVDVPVTDRFMLQARALLPPGRGVMHVLYSAPHLFHITCSTSCTDKPSMHKAISSREGASTDAAAATVAAPMCGDSKKDTDCVRLSSASFQVRFILHPYYIPPQHHSREELQTQLDALDSRTAASFPSASSTRPRLATVEATTSSSMVEQRIIRNRRKRRALTRQLEYLIRPSPFFDERVLAQCLFDALPMHDGVPVHKLVGTALPMSARACMPRDGSALLRRYPHLFSVVTPHDGVTMLSNGISFCQAHGTNRLCRSDEHEQQREQKLHSPQQRDGHAIAPMTTHAAITAAGAAALCSPASVTMVYRSDVAMAVPRAARSIDGEEILLELFNRFPAHQHPARGTCIFRCLAKLPVVMQQRLHQTCSVEEEILRPYPEKVEVLTRSHNRVSFKQAQRPHRSCQQEEEQQRPPCLRSRMYSMSMNTLDKCGVPTDGAPATAEVSYTEEQLRCCRGRRDFFIAFRFVGAWQKELLRRYEKGMMCADSVCDALSFDCCDDVHSHNSDAAEARLSTARSSIIAELQHCSLSANGNHNPSHTSISGHLSLRATHVSDGHSAWEDDHGHKDSDEEGEESARGGTRSRCVAASSSSSRLGGVFGEIVTKAAERGRLMGAVLVAVCGITNAIQHAPSSCSLVRALPQRDAGARGGCGGQTAHGCTRALCTEGSVLVRLARMYFDLYRCSPVPTRQAWHGAMHAMWQTSLPHSDVDGVYHGTEQTNVVLARCDAERVACDYFTSAVDRNVVAAAAPTVAPADLASSSASHVSRNTGGRTNDRALNTSLHASHSSNGCRTEAALHDECQANNRTELAASLELLLRGHVCQQPSDDTWMSDDAHDEDDGSFTEAKLREFLTCCLRLGRRCVRPRDTERARGVLTVSLREMLTVVHNYLHSQDMEW